MAYDVFDIAAYVINYSIDEGRPVSNLSLQKMMYYIQAAFLLEMKDTAFDEPISAWKYGPVVEEVYYKFKHYIDSTITDKITSKSEREIEMENGSFKTRQMDYDCEKTLCDDAKNIIRRVIDFQSQFTPFQLVRRTHEEDPWKKAKLQNKGYIDIEEIRNYFLSHGDRIYGS